MTKEKLLQIYEDILEQEGREITRDKFVKLSKVPKRTIQDLFGGFGGLKDAFNNNFAPVARREAQTVPESPAIKKAMEVAKLPDGAAETLKMSKNDILRYFYDLTVSNYKISGEMIPPTKKDFVSKTVVSEADINREFGSWAAFKHEKDNIDAEELVKMGVFRKIGTGFEVVPPITEIKEATFEGNVKTLDELAQHCNIDLKEWEATKFSASVWDGKCSAKGEFKRRIEEKSVDDMLENFILQAEKHAPKTFVYDVPDKSGKLFILNVSDLHLGKPASKAETGWGNYNIPKAKNVYREAIFHLMNSVKTENIEKVLLVCGSDQIHFENSAITTTKGTRLEAAGSWYEVFNETCDLMTEVIEELASKFKVEIVCVYGNHAQLSEYALGSYIKAFFRNHENVNVNNQPLDRKYFAFRKNLIGFGHGDGPATKEIGLIMFRENQATISNFKQFTFLQGHIHQDKMVEIKGVRVITCPALCPPDKFHSSHGFVGNNQCGQGLLFADWGLEKIVYSPNVV